MIERTATGRAERWRRGRGSIRLSSGRWSISRGPGRPFPTATGMISLSRPLQGGRPARSAAGRWGTFPRPFQGCAPGCRAHGGQEDRRSFVPGMRSLSKAEQGLIQERFKDLGPRMARERNAWAVARPCRGRSVRPLPEGGSLTPSGAGMRPCPGPRGPEDGRPSHYGRCRPPRRMGMPCVRGGMGALEPLRRANALRRGTVRSTMDIS